ncbi:hypothetical protein quinque_013900 [Culex quinquefasciatus]
MEGVPGKVVVGVGAELRVDGQQEAPLAAGQQQQFQIESLLQSSPQAAQYIEWFVQQRGYVAELFRREQEVVQRQLAEMHQQQLDFIQQQGHLVRNILAALTAAEQNRETRDGDRARHEENNNKEIEVSLGISGHCVEHLATSSTETTLNTGCQLVNPSTFGPGTATDALKADCKNSVPATIGTLEFQSTKAAAPVLAGLEWIIDPGGDYENLSQPPGAIVSLGTSQQLTQSTLAGPQCTFGCLDDVKGLCRKATGSTPPPQTSARRSGTTSRQQSHAAHPAGPRPEVNWNRSHPDHSVLAKRDEAFDEVSCELGMSMPELKHHWRTHGGKMATKINNTIAAVISNPVEVERMGSRMQEVKDK